MDSDTKLIGNMALLPIRSQFKGPAPRESTFIIISENLPVYSSSSSHGLLQASPSKSDEESRVGNGLQFIEKEKSFQILKLCKS